MKTKPNDGGPAFACANELFHQSGMTLRQYYAGQAMAGLCACVESWKEQTPEQRAIYAVKNADALIAELEKEKE